VWIAAVVACAAPSIRERVLELTYTAWDMAPFARDLGDDGSHAAGTKTAGTHWQSLLNTTQRDGSAALPVNLPGYFQ
jgi:hypothetical protein